jgi:hypothetical protein
MISALRIENNGTQVIFYTSGGDNKSFFYPTARSLQRLCSTLNRMLEKGKMTVHLNGPLGMSVRYHMMVWFDRVDNEHNI